MVRYQATWKTCTFSPLQILSQHNLSPLILPHCSTSAALLFANHSFHSLLQTNKSVGACFLNLKKVLDSVPHKPLINQLSSLHFPPYLSNRLHSYFLARSQQVISGTSSSPIPVTSGVPQGSIIGPLLFIIYINGLCNVSLSASSKHILFAHDILLFRPVNSLSVFSLFQNDLNSITTWLTSQISHLNLINQIHAYFL